MPFVMGIKLFFWTIFFEKNFFDKLEKKKSLRFYIDEKLMFETSHKIFWTTYETTVTPGFHLFRWEYVKDILYSVGRDAAFIRVFFFFFFFQIIPFNNILIFFFIVSRINWN